MAKTGFLMVTDWCKDDILLAVAGIGCGEDKRTQEALDFTMFRKWFMSFYAEVCDVSIDVKSKSSVFWIQIKKGYCNVVSDYVGIEIFCINLTGEKEKGVQKKECIMFVWFGLKILSVRRNS